jgi:hypothetical protein
MQTTMPLLLDPLNSKFPDDIVLKINNIICDDYIKKLYLHLENNFIKNIIKTFLNDKKLSKFLYYLGYQTYYFNYIYTVNFGIYGELLNNLEWGDFETDILSDDYNGITVDDKKPYILNIPRDEIFMNESNHSNDIEHDFYRFDVNIYSSNLTLNETLWIFKYYAIVDSNILKDNTDDDFNDDIDIDDNTYHNIYDYDMEQYANIWNLFNRGFVQLNIFKIIYIYCFNNDFDDTIKKFYNFIGGKGSHNIDIDSSKIFHKTCYNVIKYFNKKIKKAAEDRIVLSYLYAIYADDDGVYFNEEHEIQENKAYDILNDNGLLKGKSENITDILDLLYELYLK